MRAKSNYHPQNGTFKSQIAFSPCNRRTYSDYTPIKWNPQTFLYLCICRLHMYDFMYVFAYLMWLSHLCKIAIGVHLEGYLSQIPRNQSWKNVKYVTSVQNHSDYMCIKTCVCDLDISLWSPDVQIRPAMCFTTHCTNRKRITWYVNGRTHRCPTFQSIHCDHLTQ